jgi:hypothetical protein
MSTNPSLVYLGLTEYSSLRITVLKSDGSTIWMVIFRWTTHLDCAALRHYFHSLHSTHLCSKLWKDISMENAGLALKEQADGGSLDPPRGDAGEWQELYVSDVEEWGKDAARRTVEEFSWPVAVLRLRPCLLGACLGVFRLLHRRKFQQPISHTRTGLLYMLPFWHQVPRKLPSL